MLLDNFFASGTSLDEYIKIAEEIDKNTYFEQINFEELCILDFFERKNESLSFRVIGPGEYGFSDKGQMTLPELRKIHTKQLNSEQMELIDELSKKSRTLFTFHDKSGFYFLASTLYKTLGSRQHGVGGRFLKTPCFERNLALCSALTRFPITVNALIRTDGRLKKMFAVFSKTEERIPYKNIAETIAAETGLSCVSWEVDHQKVEVYTEYTNKTYGDFIPGIVFRISDTGYYACTATLTMRHKNANHAYMKFEEIPYAGGSLPQLEALYVIICNRIETLRQDCLLGDYDAVAQKYRVKKALGTGANKEFAEYFLTQPKERWVEGLFLIPELDNICELSAYQAEQYREVLCG